MASDSEGVYEPSDAESAASDVSGSAPEQSQRPSPGLASSSRRVHDTLETATLPYAQSPRKRRATNQEINVPLKRMRSAFNAGYLDLLNQDISDAAAAVSRNENSYSRLALEPSQIGALYWRVSEKEAFFSALGRLGRDDHAGIAARIGSKSPLEVAQFITLLSERDKARKDDRASWRETLRPVSIPAAAEISHKCCVALDGVADDLSVRQETHEQALEEKRWGAEHWLVTQSLVSAGHADAATARKIEGELPFAKLFVLPNWLRLSERVFMNSTVPDCNWCHVSEEPPAIRATALSDFHELARSVTRRLVVTTLFMSESRIKARRAPTSRAKQAVKARDVQAAVESLNLKSDSHDFWARAARRLRLNVHGDGASQTDDESWASSSPSDDEEEATDDEEEATDKEDEGDQESSDEDYVLSYDEVEAAFGIAAPGRHRDQPPTELSSQYLIDEDETSPSEDETKPAVAPTGDGGDEDDDEEEHQEQEHDVGIDQQELKKDNGSDSDTPSDKPDGHNPSLDQAAINRDIVEVLNFSAEVVESTRARDGVRTRVTAEHVMEAEADDADARYSAREEALLWNIIRQQQLPPPTAALKRERSSEYARNGGGKAATTGFTNRATMEHTARNWREGFRYIAEWETYGTFPPHEM